MDLCGKPYSAADYLEITKTFGTVFLLDVPKMGMDRKDLVRSIYFWPRPYKRVLGLMIYKARRFITFIDACYESKGLSFFHHYCTPRV